MGRDFLSVSFESKDLSERGHVHFYQLLTDPQEVLLRLKTVTTVEGFDPKSIAWNSYCNELVVASMGKVHTINGVFEDPRPAVDILIPSFGLNVDRRSIPFSEGAIKGAGVREVFTKCDSGSHTAVSTHVQDIEPVHVTVDENNVAYMLFQTNNAIGRMDLKDPFAPMTYHNLGMKSWEQMAMDTSYEDGGINQNPHVINSLYQPGHAVAFTFANKTWLATADGGRIKQYSVRSGSTTLCNFDESADGRSWKQAFTSMVTQNTAAELQANLTTVTSRMRFSRLKSIQDGYNPLQMGYDYLLTYGGRGWSLMDAVSMQRVYDSGDLLETFYTSTNVKDNQKAMYNNYYTSATHTQTQNADRTSPMFGPNPTAIATGNINGTQVVAVANGYVGGLYFFSITGNSTQGPDVAFEGFERRGSPGLTWTESYKLDTDAVGEPGITDLIWISDAGQNVVAAVSSIAGAVSFYSVDVML
ncbi:uncharacterized protein LOC101853761 [Aplysia californica]|uniref:Uncharacterized protein LOC101853761 n=1 Tax=Aplysia californica TaxID=6500 RepID=A0ABM0JE68_APLCA|nr:uncharacterized protein LOC101853761 [Aplysia californica]